MQFRSDEQRRAMFAAMRQGAKSSIRGIHSSARKFYKRHPLLSETIIAAPVIAAGLYGTHKIQGLSKVAGFIGRRGKAGTFATTMGIDFLTFGTADSAARRLAMGRPGKQRPEPKMSTAVIAGFGAEGIGRGGLAMSRRLIASGVPRKALARSAILGGIAFGQTIKTIRKWPFRKI
jgi:hypothetical protein